MERPMAFGAQVCSSKPQAAIDVLKGSDDGFWGEFMITFGLLGCGRIAKREADLLGGGHVEGVRLSAVCDLIRLCAEAIASNSVFQRILLSVSFWRGRSSTRNVYHDQGRILSLPMFAEMSMLANWMTT